MLAQVSAKVHSKLESHPDESAVVPPGSCIHFVQLKQSRGVEYLLKQYSIIVQHFVACCSPADRRRRAYSAVCSVCRERQRLHVCLLCVHLACHQSPKISSHILAHVTSGNNDHRFAVDLDYGQLLCCDCRDYVYDSQFSNILHQYSNRARLDLGLPALTQPWEPSDDEISLLKRHPKRRKLSSNLTIGLRGLLNLGSTCFMNSIVQCLVHTPFIRDYFLSEQHRCHDQQSSCLGCEISSTFREFYSGQQHPYIPHRLLHLMWKHAKHLAGYEQQDAHEFVVATLDILHEHLTRNKMASSSGSTSSSSSTCSSTPPCSCIIHKVFTGYLQSDVTCHNCNSSRTTIDPFWDISLDLHDPTKYRQSSQNNSQPESHDMSLIDCIKRFTRPEHLTGAKIECAVCRTFEEDVWSKQLTFKQLPLVICFHLKRFSGSTNGSHRKIGDRVSFPLNLDMSPFITPTVLSGDSHSKETASCNDALQADANSYTLFGLVYHTGQKLDGGHYVSYVRQNNDWFRCDDHLVTLVSSQEVLTAEGYLLFYHKKFVDYAVATPNFSNTLS